MQNIMRKTGLCAVSIFLSLLPGLGGGGTLLAQAKNSPSASEAIQEFLQRLEKGSAGRPFAGSRIAKDKDGDGQIIGLSLTDFPLRAGDARTIGQMKKLARLNLRGSNISDEDLRQLGSLTNLQHLDLWDTKISDAGMDGVVKMSHLKSLSLGDTKITDASLPRIAKLAELRQLVLARTRITDAGLKSLVGHKQLAALNLSETEIGDAGLKTVTEMPALRGVALDGSKVTAEGVVRFSMHDGFDWMATEAGVANELARRVSAADTLGAEAILSIGLELPHDGKFMTRFIRALPVTDKDTERKRRRFRVEWVWERDKKTEGLFAELAIQQGTARIIEMGITEE